MNFNRYKKPIYVIDLTEISRGVQKFVRAIAPTEDCQALWCQTEMVKVTQQGDNMWYSTAEDIGNNYRRMLKLTPYNLKKLSMLVFLTKAEANAAWIGIRCQSEWFKQLIKDRTV